MTRDVVRTARSPRPTGGLSPSSPFGWPRLPALLLAATLAAACGNSSEGPVSAGAGRDAPADVGAVNDAPGDVAPEAQDDPVPGDSAPDPPTETAPDTPSEPPDRTLRHGVVGTVTLVTDGDTVHVTVNGWYHRVRIQGINAPECEKSLASTADGRQYVCTSDQEYWGLAASQALQTRAEGHRVTVLCDQPPGVACPLDTFDRPLAFLEDDEGDIGEWMARNGHAFSFTKFASSRRARYCQAEDLAITERLGMWALGERDQVLALMNQSTREWYEDRDQRCAEATR